MGEARKDRLILSLRQDSQSGGGAMAHTKVPLGTLASSNPQLMNPHRSSQSHPSFKPTQPSNIGKDSQAIKRHLSDELTLRFLHHTVTSITDRLSGWQGHPPSVEEREEEMRREAESLAQLAMHQGDGAQNHFLSHSGNWISPTHEGLPHHSSSQPNLQTSEKNYGPSSHPRLVPVYRPKTPPETPSSQHNTIPDIQDGHICSAERLEQIVESINDSLLERVAQHVTTQLRSRFPLAQHQTTAGGSVSNPPERKVLSPTGEPFEPGQDRRVNEPKRSGQPTKRKVEDRESDDDEDEGGQSPSKSRKNKGKDREGEQYACPYFKYNQTKYKSWKGCAGPGWPSVHRVKEHIYRKHRQPKHRCVRCGEVFKDEKDHVDHQRRAEPCTLRPAEPIEGFDTGQEVRLKSRKKVVTELCEVEKWKAMFRILFPHVKDDDIPSPFYDLTECEQYTLREFPALLRQALKLDPDRYCNTDEGLKTEEIDAIIRNVLGRVFVNFRNLNQQDQASTSCAFSEPPPGEGTSSWSHPVAPEEENESRKDVALQDAAIATEAASDFDFDMADLQFDVSLFGGLTEGLTIEHLLEVPLAGGNEAEDKKPLDSGYQSSPNTLT